MARITKPLTNTEVQNAKPKAKKQPITMTHSDFLSLKPCKHWILLRLIASR